MKGPLFLVVLLLLAIAPVQPVNGQPVNEDTVPGYQGTNVPETGYSGGQMSDDAETRALQGQGLDGEAARTIINGAPVRPKIKVDRTESWYTGAAKGEKSPKDFFSVMKDSYGDCTGGDSNTIPALNAYDYNCRSSLTVCRKMRVMSCSRRGWGCLKLLSVGDQEAEPPQYPPAQDIMGGLLRFFFNGSSSLYIIGRNDVQAPNGFTYYEELKFEAFQQEVSRFRLIEVTHKDPVEISINGASVYSDLNRSQSDGWAIWKEHPGIDLLPHLVNGVNTLRVYVPNREHGYLYAKVNLISSCCKALSDTWRETCP